MKTMPVPARTVIDRLNRALSCPYEPMDSASFEELVVTYGREYALLFIARFRPRLRKASPALLQFIERSLAQRLEFASTWDTAFASAQTAVLSPTNADPIRTAVALALCLSANGHPGRWTIDGISLSGLRWGPWLLPQTDSLDHRSDGNTSTIRLNKSERRHAFDVPSAIREREHLDRLAEIVLADGKNALLFPSARDIGQPALHDRDAQFGANLEAALLVIRRHAPEYFEWVARVLRTVTPAHPEEHRQISSSQASLPGEVKLSYPATATSTAEMLVHECSHQYMHIMCRMNDLSNGSDGKLYYSPAKGTTRPIEAIAIAYHAFANIALLYHSCLENNIPERAFCAEQLSANITLLAALEEPLRTSRGLTDAGQALWRPLASRLRRIPAMKRLRLPSA